MNLRATILVLSLLCETLGSLPAQTLSLPVRPSGAMTGQQLATNSSFLTTNLIQREEFIRAEILRGNLPTFLRHFVPVSLTNAADDGTNRLTIYVAPNYLALGSDDDFLLTPMTPESAQRIADATDCILPTRKLADAIYANACVKLAPRPLPPNARMTTPAVFLEHNAIILAQLGELTSVSNALVAGIKKDVVVTPRLMDAPGKVAIYGWHQTNGLAIQPLYLGHTAAWVDYSHGIRLIAKNAVLNGQPTNLIALLADPKLCGMVSDEGPVPQPRYTTNFLAATERSATGPRSQRAATERSVASDPRASDQQSAADGDRPHSDSQRRPQGFTASKHFGELTRELNLPDGVHIVINTPLASSFATNRSVQLIFFALPNGNTIEWTAGKRLANGDDWHYDIQHIAAQTRFLRSVITNKTIVVAYLENSLKSWPAWRKSYGNDRIPSLFAAVRKIFADYSQEIVLTGHSGGGSLTFGYLNAVTEIPSDVKRIAFLDSNYAYETTNHFAKLLQWLKASNQNHLCILAYHDSIALLNGKTFVSERGGTWGRSHAMLEDIGREFKFTSTTNNAGLQRHSAAQGRIQFLLKANPEKKILHTVQVDRNGFIHAMLTGTSLENCSYEYFGERVYGKFITFE